MLEDFELPQDLDSERCLLSTICAPGAEQVAAQCMTFLRDDDFMHPSHRAVFGAVRGLVNLGQEITPFAITASLGASSESVGGFSGVIEVLQGMEVEKPRALVDILTKLRKRRDLIKIGHRMAIEARSFDHEPHSTADRASSELMAISVDPGKRGMVSGADCAFSVIEDLESDHITGTITGFNRMDEMTQGFQPGQMVILAARPGIGKTALALNWSLRAASQGPVLFFSLEMGTKELTKRLACNLGSVPQKAVKTRTLTSFQDAAFREALNRISKMPIFINDNAAITAQEIRSFVQRQTVSLGSSPAMVVVDHIGLVASDGKGKSEALRIGEISRSLKVMAKDLGCPVVVLSQLNREVEKSDRFPILADLRDSGCLEQDADIVMFIHRKAKPQVADAPPDRTANLIIAKHRDGELAQITLDFQGGYCRYEEVEQSTETTNPRGW